MMRLIAACLLLASAPLAYAAGLRPFDSGSPEAIRKAETGRPFVLAFWSTGCEPCREDMKVLRRALQGHPGLRVHLVAVDPPEDRAAILAFLRRYDPGRAVRWAFADSFGERVRYAVDPAWRGELPRTYLYDRDHRALVLSGTLSEAQLARWIARQRRP